jgi:lysophospholipase L1-like esterase
VALKGKPRVLMIGDSLSEGTKPYLPRYLGGWRVRQSFERSRTVPDGARILARAKRPAGVIIISLGTNDHPGLVSEFRRGLRRIMRIAGRKRCVVWPNIVRPPVDGTGYGGINRVLAREDRRRNLRVVDWVRMVRRNRHWLAGGGDGVHVTADGYAARARAIAEAVRACGRIR